VEEEIASQPARGEREKRWMGQKFLACLRSHNLGLPASLTYKYKKIIQET
jgi:hypothetical protein